jgi:acyl-CoA dehydrogenase
MAIANGPEVAVGASLRPGDLAQVVRRIADEVAGPAAGEVDLEARFPEQSLTALKSERLLGALIPVTLGGLGATISDIAIACETLAQRCANTALIYAMHQIQVHCLIRHSRHNTLLRRYLTQIAEQQLLLASATTETGVGGDIRTSRCSVLLEGDTYLLEKSAGVISYGVNADGILATARRTPDAAPGDQVLVLCTRDGTSLERTTTWDTLGFRGTCSEGYQLRSRGPAGHVLPESFALISALTMLPTSHVLWTSVWLGIATDAVNRARAYLRSESRKDPGHMPMGALRLAEAVSALQTMRATLRNALQEYELAMEDPNALSAMGFALRMNNLKLAGARLVVEIVSETMRVTGITGYRRDSSYSVERHLRDAYGAELMISNDRIQGANAAMLLVAKDA